MSDKQTLLIVEDDPNLAEMLNEYFRAQGYRVLTSEQGEAAIQTCTQRLPHLVLLDIHLPDIDGYEVAQRLYAHRRTKNIPVIFLTEKKNRTNRLQGLQLGAVDYITKPFDLDELQLRVRNTLQRAHPRPSTNPVTGLPQGQLVDEYLARALQGTAWAVLRVSLRGLSRFRDTYGFMASDDVLRAVGLILDETVYEVGTEEDLAGHLTTDDFVVITTLPHLYELQERIRTRLNQSLRYLYPRKDRPGSGQLSESLTPAIEVLIPRASDFADLSTFKKAVLHSRSN